LVQTSLGIKQDPISKTTNTKRTDVQMAKLLPSKLKAQDPSPPRKSAKFSKMNITLAN
jgi:hypothetical protein